MKLLGYASTAGPGGPGALVVVVGCVGAGVGTGVFGDGVVTDEPSQVVIYTAQT